MVSEKNKLGDLFKRKFEHFEVQPSEKVWKEIRSDLYRKQFLQFRPGSFNIYYLSVLLITGLATFLTLSVTKDRDQDVMRKKDYQIDLQESIVSDQIQTDQPQSFDDHPGITEIINNGRPQIVYPELSSHKQESVVNQQYISKQPSSPDLTQKESFERNQYIRPQKSAVSYFNVSSREGCMPLSVKFYNHSENSVNYLWSFGDGGTSTEKNPSYIFDKPGTYFVNLTVIANEGDMSAFTDSIRVYPLPEAHFEVDSLAVPGSGQPAYFYNYSQGAEYYIWDFGDGSTSNEKDPSHYYEHPGNYNIRLIAESLAGCRDSAIMKNVFSENSPEIIFPNAFSPNINGPSGGFYKMKDSRNDIFHPVYGEQPEEYQLRIFNRAGILIFESNDINIGWDGYFHQELLPQGVYVWKARGRFSNGRNFVKMGDVTMIWRKER